MTKIDNGPGVTPRPSQSAAPSPDYANGRAADTDSAMPIAREPAVWRSVAANVTALGAPVCIGLLHPLLLEIVSITELVMALTIISLALFGSPDLIDRAFRLLRWIRNRPEPPAPEASGAGRGRPVTSASSGPGRLWSRAVAQRGPVLRRHHKVR